MVFQITHEIKFNLTCEWLSNSAVHFIGIKIWPAIPCSNFFSYWLFFPSFFRNKKSNWFVVVDFKCVYGRDFPFFCFLEMKTQRQNQFVRLVADISTFDTVLVFLFQYLLISNVLRSKTYLATAGFQIFCYLVGFSQNQNTAKNNFVLVINNGCLEGWDLFGTRLPPPKLHPLQSSDCLCLWCVAEQKQGFMFSLLLKFSIKQNQFVLDTWICWRVRFTPFVFCFVFCILF